MTEREKLIKLLDDGCYKACSDASGRKVNEVLADYLLANGVIVVDTNSVKRENLPLIQQAFNMPLDELAKIVEKHIAQNGLAYATPNFELLEG